jgi:hypothetical protein
LAVVRGVREDEAAEDEGREDEAREEDVREEEVRDEEARGDDVRDEREADLADGRVAALDVLGGTVPPISMARAPAVREAAAGFLIVPVLSITASVSGKDCTLSTTGNNSR